LEDYLAHVALFTDSDTGEKGDRVKLMTVHAVKSLEFPYVFLPLFQERDPHIIECGSLSDSFDGKGMVQ